MTFEEIRVAEELDFKDISEEKTRVYYFPNGDEFVVHEPVALHVSASGGHRIIEASGRSVYIKGTWIAFVFGPVKAPRLHWKF